MVSFHCKTFGHLSMLACMCQNRYQRLTTAHTHHTQLRLSEHYSLRTSSVSESADCGGSEATALWITRDESSPRRSKNRIHCNQSSMSSPCATTARSNTLLTAWCSFLCGLLFVGLDPTVQSAHSIRVYECQKGAPGDGILAIFSASSVPISLPLHSLLQHETLAECCQSMAKIRAALCNHARTGHPQQNTGTISSAQRRTLLFTGAQKPFVIMLRSYAPERSRQCR